MEKPITHTIMHCIVYNIFLQLEETEDKAKVLDEYTKGHLSKRSMNKKNLKLFIECYMNRMDFTGKLEYFKTNLLRYENYKLQMNMILFLQRLIIF